MVQSSVKQAVLAQACPCVKLGLQLGEGGNARVYAGTSPQHGDVAVKFLLNSAGKRLARFEDEVKVVRNVLNGSPYVLPILDTNVPAAAGTIPWYVMPAALGLTESLAAKTLHERLEVLVQLGEGLAAIHQAGVAHRDIKPENMLAWNGKYLFADFGLADFESSAGVTEANERMGPLFYIAPEMLVDSQADGFKADVYSFAKSMWVILTEEKFPFQGQYDADGFFGLYRRAKGHRQPVFEPLDVLLRQTTDDDPQRRPTAQQLLAELRKAVEVQKSFAEANARQWAAAEKAALSDDGLKSATWEGAQSIAHVFTTLSRRDGLNHLFLPDGGGNTIEFASVCEGEKMLRLKVQVGGSYVVKPKSLTLHRFPGRPELNIAVLTTLDVEPLGDARMRGPWSEPLLQLDDFDYLSVREDADLSLPAGMTVEHCERYFRGGEFTFAPTGGFFNNVDDYSGSHATKAQRYLEEVKKRLQAEAAGTTKSVHTQRLPRVIRSLEDRATPFFLQHIDDDMFYRLVLADDSMKSRYNGSTGKIVNSADPELFKRVMQGPSEQRKQSLALLKSMSREQLGEYLALVSVGRGDCSPSEFRSTADYHARSSHATEYYAEKLGNNYLRKAVSRFGLSLELPE